jgi:hypothetical protein
MVVELYRFCVRSAIPHGTGVIRATRAELQFHARTRRAPRVADFLEEILRAERDARRARAREMFTRVAGFPTVKTLGAV